MYFLHDSIEEKDKDKDSKERVVGKDDTFSSFSCDLAQKYANMIKVEL